MEGHIFRILRYFVPATYFHIALRNEIAPFNNILIGTNDIQNIARENWTRRGDYLFLPSNKSQIMEKRNNNNKTICQEIKLHVDRTVNYGVLNLNCLKLIHYLLFSQAMAILFPERQMVVSFAYFTLSLVYR